MFRESGKVIEERQVYMDTRHALERIASKEEFFLDADELEDILAKEGFSKQKIDPTKVANIKGDETVPVYVRIMDNYNLEVLTDYDWETGEPGARLYEMGAPEFNRVLKKQFFEDPLVFAIEAGISLAGVGGLLGYKLHFPPEMYGIIAATSVVIGVIAYFGGRQYNKQQEIYLDYDIISEGSVENPNGALLDILDKPEQIRARIAEMEEHEIEVRRQKRNQR